MAALKKLKENCEISSFFIYPEAESALIYDRKSNNPNKQENIGETSKQSRNIFKKIIQISFYKFYEFLLRSFKKS